MVGKITTHYKDIQKSGHSENTVEFTRTTPSKSKANFSVDIKKKNGKVTVVASSSLALDAEITIVKKHGKKEKIEKKHISSSSSDYSKIYAVAKEQLAFMKKCAKQF